MQYLNESYLCRATKAYRKNKSTEYSIAQLKQTQKQGRVIPHIEPVHRTAVDKGREHSATVPESRADGAHTQHHV